MRVKPLDLPCRSIAPNWLMTLVLNAIPIHTQAAKRLFSSGPGFHMTRRVRVHEPVTRSSESYFRCAVHDMCW